MYSSDLAKKYWEERIKTNSNLNSVLYFSENETVNFYYDCWEKAIVLRSLPDINGKNILDIPVGIGRWTNTLAKRGAIIDCVDISDEIVNIALKNIDPALRRQVNFYVFDIGEILSLNKSYDYIICTGLFEHLPEDKITRSLQDFSNLLSPSGILILVINNMSSKLLEKGEDNPYRVNSQYQNGYYCGLTDIDKVQEILKQNGISIIHYAINPAYSLLRYINRNLKNGMDMSELFRAAVTLDCNHFDSIVEPQNMFSDQIILFGRKLV